VPWGEAGYDHHYKFQPVINALNSRLKAEYTPSIVMAVDQSMIQITGCSSKKQYMPKKPVKGGY